MSRSPGPNTGKPPQSAGSPGLQMFQPTALHLPSETTCLSEEGQTNGKHGSSMIDLFLQDLAKTKRTTPGNYKGHDLWILSKVISIIQTSGTTRKKNAHLMWLKAPTCRCLLLVKMQTGTSPETQFQR